MLLFTEIMFIYLENPKEFIDELLELISTVGHRIQDHCSNINCIFIYQLAKITTIPFTMDPRHKAREKATTILDKIYPMTASY